MIKLFSLMTILLTTNANAHFYNNYTLSLGMINHSVAENESTLKEEGSPTTTAKEEETPEAVSAISVDATYEFLPTQQRTYFIRGSVPLLTTGGAGVFLLGGGVNFYLSELSTKYSYESRGSKVEITPDLKYYWGLNTGVGYLVYNTQLSKKSDLFFDLGVHGGGAYALSPTRALRAEIGAARSTGVTTTGFKINVFIGLVQYL